MNEEILNVKITGSKWENERCLSHWIFLEGDGWSIGFGGYCLKGEACYDWITQIMKVLEIDDFNEKTLIGKIVRVKEVGFGNPVEAIGHPIKDIWFNPKEFFAKHYSR